MGFDRGWLIYLYFTIRFFYGSIFYLYGPLIPYFAEESGKPETDFIIIFTVRGIAYLLGAILQFAFLSDIKYLHVGLFVTIIFSSIGSYLMASTVQITYLMIASFMNSFFFCILDILTSVCVLQSSGDVVKNASRNHAFEGFGAMVGPFMLGLIGKIALKFLSVLLFCCAILLLADLFWKVDKRKNEEEGQNEKQELPLKIQNKFCVLFMIHAIIELTYKSWFPSFCLMMHYTTKEQGAFMISFIVGIMILIRFTIRVEVTTMLKVGVNGSLVLFMSLILAYFANFVWYIVYGACVIFAIILSLQYPYYFGLISESGYKTSLRSCSKYLISYSIGESIFVSFAGILMKRIHPMSLYFYALFWAVVNKGVFTSVIENLQSKKQELLSSQELKEIS